MKRILVALVSLLVVACTSSSKTELPQASNRNNNIAANTDAASSSTAAKSASSAMHEKELNNLASEIQRLEKQSDYFDYNKFVVKPEYKDVLQKEAAFIKEHKHDIVTLEGNADERGGAEYNFELGNKRAEAVENSLKMMGVPANQLKVVSLGEAKARLSCHEEKCWKENRRVDFVHSLN